MAGQTFFTVGTAAPLNVQGPAVITNTNASGTLYVGGPAVTSGSNDFSIAAGASRIIFGEKYLIGSVQIQVLAKDADPSVSGAAGSFPGESQFTNWRPNALTDGTDSTPVNTEVYFQRLNIPQSATLTGVQYLIGSVGGTDKAIVALYDYKGNVLANSALAGVTVGTLATVQQLPFTAPYVVTGPGVYHIGLSFNGGTARYRATAAGGFTWANKATGQTFGTLGAITPPTASTTSAFIGGTY